MVFRAGSKLYLFKIIQQGFPLKLIAYTGMDSMVRMADYKYLLFNKQVTLNYMNSGDEYYTFEAGPEDVGYFQDRHGIMFEAGRSYLGGDYKYIFDVSDNDGNVLIDTVTFSFYSKKVDLDGIIHKIKLDDNNDLWVLASYINSWPQEPAHLYKFKFENGEYVLEHDFEIEDDKQVGHFYLPDFTINPYNDLIYITNYYGEDIMVFNKSGDMLKRIDIEPVDTCHPNHPSVRPSNIGFTNSGLGLIRLRSRGTSGIDWRFIDSSNDDIVTHPSNEHPLQLKDFSYFVLNHDESALFAVQDGPSTIITYNSEGEFTQYPLYLDGIPGRVYDITQHKFCSKIFLSGWSYQQIITLDLSYRSQISNDNFPLSDFCYDPDLENHVYTMGTNPAYFALGDYDNAETVFSYSINGIFACDNMHIAATTDNRYIVIGSANSLGSAETSQITFFDTRMFEDN